MVDGDALLVLADKKIIEIAKRNMNEVYPLYYPMKKANKEIIDNEKIYNGLEAAFTGGRIGGISNNITKIWASDNIDDDAKSAVKWLCLETNFTIDYAKTLFKPKRPKNANKIIRSYTKKKVPYFFTFAKSAKYGKGENLSSVEDIGVGVMDRITQNITSNRLMFSTIKNLAPVDYRKMLDNEWPDYTNENIDRRFDYYNRTYGYNIRYDEDDKSKNNISYLLQDMRNDLLRIEPDESKIITSLVIHMYKKNTQQKKNLLWLLYGDIMCENIETNCKGENNICLKCGRRVEYKLIGHKCRACRNEENRNGFKKIVCADCGTEFTIPNSSRMIRCDDCRTKRRQEQYRNSKKANKLKIPQGQTHTINES